MRHALVLGLLMLGAPAEEIRLPWLGDNLVPNPGFETVKDGVPASWHCNAKGDGVVVASDRGSALQGRHSVRLHVPLSGTHASVSSALIPVEGERVYFVSMAFRQVGFSTRKTQYYCGVSSYPRLFWLDENKRNLGHSRSISQFPYGPAKWDLRDAFERAPAAARFARIDAYVTNNSRKKIGRDLPSTLWLDAVQLRAYTPLPTPAWAQGKAERVVDGAAPVSPVIIYFAAEHRGFRQQDGQWSRTVTDAEAEHGSALAANIDTTRGIMAHGPYVASLPAGMGLYRLQVRARVAPGAGKVGFVDLNSESAGMRLVLPITGVPGNGGYQLYEGDFILRDNGWWCPRIYTLGKQPWRVDYVKVIPIFPLTDQQLLSIYPGSTGDLPEALAPPPMRLVLGGPQTTFVRSFVVAGVGYDWYRLAEALHILHRDSETTVAWVSRDSRTTRVSGFPDDPAELFKNTVICLVNVNMNALSLAHKNAIREFVRRGGAVMVFAGHQAYERGAYRGSLLEEVMPVTVASSIHGGFIDERKGLSLALATDEPYLAWLADETPMYVRYLHAVSPKPGAKIFVKAGDRPFIVGGKFGKGRVVCVLGQAAGVLPEGRRSFWTSVAWPHLLRDVIWWAAKYHDIPLEDAVR